MNAPAHHFSLLLLSLSLLACKAMASQEAITSTPNRINLNAYQSYAAAELGKLPPSGHLEDFSVSATPGLLATAQSIRLVSIPIFNWKIGGVYSCGEAIDSLLVIEDSPGFQRTLGVNESGEIIGTMNILTSYLRGETGGPGNESVNPLPDISPKNDKIALQYLSDHPNEVVFLVRGLEGVWTFAHKKVSRLDKKNQKFTSETPLCNYGEEFINHLIQEMLLTGHAYKGCVNCMP